MLKWYFGTRAKYDALATKDANGIYFLNDTNELYYQGKQYMNTVIMYAGAKPTTGVPGKFYFSTDTLVAETYKDGAWVTIADATGAAVLDKDGNAVTGKVSGAAVKAYIDAHLKSKAEAGVASISYDPTTRILKVTNSAGTDSTSTINSFATAISRDIKTGEIDLIAGDGTTKLATITIPPDIHVASGTYDDTQKGIVLTMSDGSKVVIPSSKLIGLYNELDSKTINVTTEEKDGVLFLQMDVNVSATADNGLSKKDDGLYCSGLGLADLLTGAVAGDALTATADGGTKDSGVAIGGAALAATPSNKTMATEAAVTAVKATINTDLDATYVKTANVSKTYAEFLAANGMTQA